LALQERTLGSGFKKTARSTNVELDSIVADGNTDIDAIFSLFGVRTLEAGAEHSVRD
jgi:hypothetical protein